MRCRKVRELLGAYVEGRLGGRQREQVEEHLRRCARCEEEVRAVRSVVGLLADLERRDLPAERWAQMEAAILREVHPPERASIWEMISSHLAIWRQGLSDAVRGGYVTLVDHGRIAIPAIALGLLCVIGGLYLERERGGLEDTEEQPLYSLYSAEESQEAPSLYSAGPVRYVR